MVTSLPRVAVVYRFLPRWRADFFCHLRDELASQNIQLSLFYGKNQTQEPDRPIRHRFKWGDEIDLDWGTAVSNRRWNVGGYELVWQHVPRAVFEADLIILMQENRLISNYGIAIRQKLRGQKLALWGHGFNHQADHRSLGNLFKRVYSTRVDWWFAYTQGVTDHLRRLGFPSDRITVVNNAIDTARLVAEGHRITPAQLVKLRLDLGLSNGPVGIFCGAMYPDKRLRFLVQACDLIRGLIPNFQMLFLGDGTDAEIVRRFAGKRSWCYYVGPCYGLDRVPYFKISDVFLIPGVVGLAVLDCFALETPLLTTNNPHHGPEIAYLSHGVDGMIAESSIEAYVSTVVKVLRSQEMLDQLKRGCNAKAQKYTLNNMVTNFANGVQLALQSGVLNEMRQNPCAASSSPRAGTQS